MIHEIKAFPVNLNRNKYNFKVFDHSTEHYLQGKEFMDAGEVRNNNNDIKNKDNGRYLQFSLGEES